MLRRIGRGLERLVGAEVHEGEWPLVLLFFVNLFLLLMAYYILKVIREPLILLGGGALSRSYARGAQAAVLALAVPGYSLVANRVEPGQLVKWVLAFFVVTLSVFFVAGHAGFHLGFTFFVWLGIFGTLAIAQFWSLANDLLSEAAGRRLFPLVAAGGTIGGIVGAQFAARALGWFDPYQLMLVAASILATCILLTHVTHGHGLRRHAAHVTDAKRDARGGFSLILRDRYLLLIAGAVILLNLINTTGEYMLAELVNAKAHTIVEKADRLRYIGHFYGNFQTYVSLLTAGVQILLVGRLFRTIGLGKSLFLLPLMAFAGYGAAAILPGLALVATVKVVEDSTDYSLQNTIQQALFLRTSRDAKYKAKTAIDTFFVRVGDLGSMAVVAAGVHVGLSVFGFALTNVAAALAWILIVRKLARHHGAPKQAKRGVAESGASPSVAALPTT
jgi:AAA family ATP:ADP antiporter